MPDAIDQRPPVAVGHVRLNVADVGAAARWLEILGLRPIVTRGELAVLELRGGTHVVVRQAERPPEPGRAHVCSSHRCISYAVFCLKKKTKKRARRCPRPTERGTAQ